MKFTKLVAQSVLGIAVIASTTVWASHHEKAKKDIVDTAVSAGQFETLATALKAADLVDALKGEGPFTVFAPTDEAFAKLPEGTVETLLKPENKEKLQSILTYHVVKGKVPAKNVVDLNGAVTLNGQRVDINTEDGVMVDGAKVVKTDVMASNGIIHVIDSVILPADKNIVETASEAGSFSTLLTAAKAAGLAGVLAEDGPFTVFAPTDDAFAKLPEGTVESLLKPENKEKLQTILKLHVVEGRVYSDAVLETKKVKTLADMSLMPKVKDGSAYVNDAKIVKTDIDASNGVVHVIDSVILPEEKSATANEAMDIIRTAINRGAPLYNMGHHDACTDIYSIASKALLHMDNLNSSVHQPIQVAMNKVSSTKDESSKAWILRHGLDEALMNLQ